MGVGVGSVVGGGTGGCRSRKRLFVVLVLEALSWCVGADAGSVVRCVLV